MPPVQASRLPLFLIRILVGSFGGIVREQLNHTRRRFSRFAVRRPSLGGTGMPIPVRAIFLAPPDKKQDESPKHGRCHDHVAQHSDPPLFSIPRAARLLSRLAAQEEPCESKLSGSCCILGRCEKTPPRGRTAYGSCPFSQNSLALAVPSKLYALLVRAPCRLVRTWRIIKGNRVAAHSHSSGLGGAPCAVLASQ